MTVACSPVSLVLPGSKHPRTPGVHLSGVIRAIALETGILKPEYEEEAVTLQDMDSQVWWASLPPEAQARICMGLAWEEFYIASQLPQVVDHPGEVELDGIYMTPDGEELTTYVVDRRPRVGLKIHEIKCTYKSMNTVMGKPWTDWDQRVYDSDAHGPVGPLSSQYMWVTQTMGYAKAKGAADVDLHVLFACGDYSYPLKPTPYLYGITYSQAELDRRWEQVVDYKHYVMRVR